MACKALTPAVGCHDSHLPLGMLRAVSSHRLPGKPAGASVVPDAPELPGKNHLASRQGVRPAQNGNSISLPRGFHHARVFVPPAKASSRPPGKAQHDMPASFKEEVSPPASSLSGWKVMSTWAAAHQLCPVIFRSVVTTKPPHGSTDS